MFTAPSAGGEVLPPRDLVGQLLIVRPTSVKQVNTANYGVKEAVRVDVAVLTQPGPDGQYGVVHRDVLWFSGRIIGGLKTRIGEMVLARMAIGTGKPGQNPPFELEDATGDTSAVQFATQWIGAHPEFAAVRPPAAAQPAPAAVPAPIPVPTAAPAAAIPAAIPAPMPAGIPAPAPVPQPIPAAVPAAQPIPTAPTAPAAAVPQPAAAPAPTGLDPAVLAQLGPDAIAQLQALGHLPPTAPVAS